MNDPLVLGVLGLLSAVVLFDTLVLIALVTIVHDLRGNPRVTLPRTSLVVGQPPPAFTVVDIDGATVSSSDLAGRVRAILIVSPNCSACYTSLEELQALESKSQGDIVLLCRGTADECRTMTAAYNLPWRVLVDQAGAVGSSFGIDRYPTAILLDPKGLVRSVGEPNRTELVEILKADEAGAA